jgi:hypothetical protein
VAPVIAAGRCPQSPKWPPATRRAAPDGHNQFCSLSAAPLQSPRGNASVVERTMILKTLATVLLFLTIQSVLAEEPKQEDKAQRFRITCDIKSDLKQGPQLALIDGELLVLTATSNVPEPDAKKFEGDATELFQLLDTPKGQLIVLRSIAIQQLKGKNFNLEGCYMTADYSNVPPSIKFTKEPEKYSYWKIPIDKNGPIVNLSDFKKPAYLSVDPQIIKLDFPAIKGHLEFLKVNLSLEPKDQFKAMKFDPPIR